MLEMGVLRTFISSREKAIIEVLMVEQDDITIKELSRKLDVSSRTIQRDLTNIEHTLTTNQLKLHRKAGVGVQIIGNEQQKQHFLSKLKMTAHREYTLEERLILILCTLYEANEPVKLYAFSKDLGVSIATVSTDIEKLQQQLAPVQLTILKKRGSGVELAGSENAKRRAISYILSKALKEEELFALVKAETVLSSDNIVSQRLLQLIDKKKLSKVEAGMSKLFPNIAHSMTDSAYAELIVHLTLAIERILRGEQVVLEKAYLHQIMKEPDYEVAAGVVDMLSECFQTDIPKAEISYMMMHLQGSKLRKQDAVLLTTSNVELHRQVKLLIEELEARTKVSLTQNLSLFEGLVAHLKPAIHRIEQNMGIVNPLLEEVQTSYEELFGHVEEATKKVFPDLVIPKEEIGYLVMHFGAVLIDALRKGDLTAYVVCSSGIGTSKLLASQLLHEIPEITKVYNVSTFEVMNLATSVTERDLIISTVDLKDFPKEYMRVSPFLSAEAMEQVQMYARRKMLVQNNTSSVDITLPVEAATKKLEQVHDYTTIMVLILKHFHMQQLPKQLNRRRYLEFICQNLEGMSVIQNSPLVVEALINREKNGGIGIPGTKLALYHTRHESILLPVFTMYKLETGMTIQGMDGRSVWVDTLLILLSPLSISASGMEALSLISSLLIKDEQSTHLFETGDQFQIHTVLAKEFEQFITEYMTGGTR